MDDSDDLLQMIRVLVEDEQDRGLDGEPRILSVDSGDVEGSFIIRAGTESADSRCYRVTVEMLKE